MSEDTGAALERAPSPSSNPPDATAAEAGARAPAADAGSMPARLRASLEECGAWDRHRLGRQLDRLTARRGGHARLREIGREVERAVHRIRQRRVPLPGLNIPAELPIAAAAHEIAKCIEAHPVTIVCGDTGSGKTTQLGKICLSHGRGVDGLVGHTQPRRIAARSVASRIAEELGPEGAGAVGFKVRFDARVDDACRLKLMTDGILLAEIQSDRRLLAYDTIIVDEAHERSLNIDFVLGYLARLLPSRPELRVVISSATIDTNRFSEFYGGAPVVDVAGRRYPVEVRYRPLTAADADAPGSAGNLSGADSGRRGGEHATGREGSERARYRNKHEARGGEGAPGRRRGDSRATARRARSAERSDGDLAGAVADAVRALWREAPHSKDTGQGNDDVLVFLPGERDIHDAARELGRLRLPGLEVLKLYARLPLAQQQKVFNAHSGRRVVLATNVAETSLTVPRIGFVIDAGLARIGRYAHRHAIQRLPVEPISQASAMQRLGRAGRLAPGVCVRLYCEEDFESREAFTEPEIRRSDLCAVLLKLAALGIGDGDDFPFIDPPDRRHVNDGYRLLRELGAVDLDDRLTEVGRKLARLPVDPRIGRMLLAAIDQGCLREMLVVASALSVQDPRSRARDASNRSGADAGARVTGDESGAHVFRDERSDFMSMIGLWDRVDERRRALGRAGFRGWCERAGLSPSRLWEWRDVHDQLRSLAQELGLTRARRPKRGKRDSDSASRAPSKAPPAKPAGYGQIHRALLAGLLRNVGMREERREYAGVRDVRFQVSRASALAESLPKWVMAAGFVQTTRTYAHQAARVRPEWVEQAAGHLLQRGHFEAHWDARRAEPMVYEQTSLYGLTITARRRIRFAPIARADARELFIRAALVEGQWRSSAPVLAHNARVIDALRALDHKLRRPDVSMRDEDVFRFYNERLPADVLDGATFETCARRLEREQPAWLRLEAATLRHSPAPANVADNYPDRLTVTALSPALELPLEYRLAPGADADGVTVTIPLARLRELDPARFEWLVPGWLAEKVTAMLRALPKSLRRELMPLPEVAEEFVAHLDAEAQPAEGLREALRRHLRTSRGADVPPAVWPAGALAGALPAHLRMRFKVVADDGEVLACGRDLARLQADLNREPELRGMGAASVQAPPETVSGWSFGDLPPSRFVETSDGQVERFPAIGDRGRGVALEWHASPVDARTAHAAGLRRLLCLACPAISGAVRHNLEMLESSNRELTLIHAVLPLPPDPGQSMSDLVDARAAPPSDRRDRTLELAPQTRVSLADELTLALADRLIADYAARNAPEAGLAAGEACRSLPFTVRTAQDFDALRQFTSGAALAGARALCALTSRVLVRCHTLSVFLGDGKKRWPPECVNDARMQLRHLVHAGFVLATPPEQLEHFERYLSALSLRLEKLDRGGARDRDKLSKLEPLWLRFASRARSHAQRGRSDAALVRYRWMMEEYRVSLFAQELGTAYPVSRKRLDEQWRLVAT